MADLPGGDVDGGVAGGAYSSALARDKAAEIVNLGAVGPRRYYDMFGVDTQCAPGTAPTVWTVADEPDPTGTYAPAFPCGGPFSPIWIGRTYTA